ncbi:hypothetical protein [Methylobacterium sp. Leaf99]|uniref:hypothetical protein n=1 Tax=Methylobacterium sp. Leaf99 TaxID=1736251 RepID=UPI0012EE07F5|nr:hypothetical protein [Methylobacterium sp. Leaf99]
MLLLRDITATMLATPIAAEPGANTVGDTLPCEVAPDGLRVTFCNGSISCELRVPYTLGTLSSGNGRFQIPSQILRLAALQVVKNKPKTKTALARLQATSRSLAPRAIYQGVPDEPAHWTFLPRTSDGKLLYDGAKLNFSASADTSTPLEKDPGLSDPVQIFPDRIRTALLATKPAAATKIDALPKLSQVAIEDGVGCASNERMYAYHSDIALAGLSFRVAATDISVLTSLMRHLDRTATTLRTAGRMCVIQDARLTIRFTQPVDTLPVINLRSSLQPTLAMQCEHKELIELVNKAFLTARTDPDAQRRLQLHLRVALIDGEIALTADATWRHPKSGMDRFRGNLRSIMIEREQARSLCERLSPPPSPTLTSDRKHTEEILARHVAPSAIEIGRYVVSDLLRAIRPLRSALLRLEFIDDRALIITETTAEHSTDYVMTSKTQEDTYGMPQRRSKRWDAPSRLRA